MSAEVIAGGHGQRWRWWRELAVAVTALAIVAMLAADARAAGRCDRPPPAIGKFRPASKPAPAPDIAFADEAGAEQRLADWRGTALVVNFWATWCQPCVTEMPALDRLAAAVAGERVRVLALSADREGAAVVRRFYAINGLTSLPVSIDRRSAVARSLGIGGLPTTVLFNADGLEVGRVVGIAEWDAPEVAAFLRRCLAPDR